MVTAASMCFPKEAVEITSDAYDKLKQAIKDTGMGISLTLDC